MGKGIELEMINSSGKYRAWTRRGVLERIRAFHRKARNIVIDWARKTGLLIVRETKSNLYVVASEDLDGLIESVRELPKAIGRNLFYYPTGNWCTGLTDRLRNTASH